MKEFPVRDSLSHGDDPVMVPYGTYVAVLSVDDWDSSTVQVQQTNTPSDTDSWVVVATCTANSIVALHGGLNVRIVRTAGTAAVVANISKSGSNP